MQQPWQTLDSAEIMASRLAGPYAKLAAFCAEEKGPDCVLSPIEGGTGSGFLGLADVSTDLGQIHLAIHAPIGWYVMPNFTVANGRDHLTSEPSFVDGHLVIRFVYSWGGREVVEEERGLVVCTLAHSFVECTPKIIVGRSTTNVSQVSADQTVELACDGTFAAGKLTVSPMKRPANPAVAAAYSKEGAAACKTVVYAGEHHVGFSN